MSDAFSHISRRADNINRRMSTAIEHTRELRWGVGGLQHEVSYDLRAPAEAALASVDALDKSGRKLLKAKGEKRTTKIAARCQEDARSVEARFRELSDMSSGLLVTASNVSHFRRAIGWRLSQD